MRPRWWNVVRRAAGIKSFFLQWQHESESTQKVLDVLTDASLPPGLPVPGVYGPSREEWMAMGMEPLA